MNLTRPLPESGYLSAIANPMLRTTAGDVIAAGADTLGRLALRGARIRNREQPDYQVIDGQVTQRTERDDTLSVDQLKAAYPWVEFDRPMTEESARVIAEARKAQMIREDVVARGPGGAAGLGASLVGGLKSMATDPLEIASAFIPVVGPASKAILVGRLGRVGGRIAEGVIEGGVGNVITEPFYYTLSRSQKLDYDMSDALLNVGLGAAFGGIIGVGRAAGAVVRGVDGVPRVDPAVARAEAEAPPAASVEPLMPDMTPATRMAVLNSSVAQMAQGLDVEIAAGLRPAGFRAFHGSPHDFDRFSLDKIGTGEGAQAYGHGLYFAENEGVARSYRDALNPDYRATLSYAGPDRARNAASMLAADIPADDVLDGLRALGDPSPEASLEAGRRILDEAKGAGHMYEVNIRANPEDFLDWDMPLAAQPSSVRERIRGIAPNAPGMASGPRLLSELHPTNATPFTSAADRAQAAASARLREAGIPGIRYLDQGSRAAGDGSRNYVVFDDKLISIVRKDGDEIHSAEADAIIAKPLEIDEEDLMLDARIEDLRQRGYLGEASEADVTAANDMVARATKAGEISRAAAACLASVPF